MQTLGMFTHFLWLVIAVLVCRPNFQFYFDPQSISGLANAQDAVTQLRDAPEHQTFVVISSARCGSNWVAQTLLSHPQILMHGESLIPNRVNGKVSFPEDKCGVSDDNWAAFEKCMDLIMSLDNTCTGRYKGSSAEFCKTRPEARARGLLLKYNWFKADDLANLASYLERRRAVVIHLYRRNVMESYLSLKDRQHRYSTSRHHINTTDFFRYNDQINAWVNNYRAALGSRNLMYFEVGSQRFIVSLVIIFPHITLPTSCFEYDVQVSYEYLLYSGLQSEIWRSIQKNLNVEVHTLQDMNMYDKKRSSERSTCEQRISNWGEVQSILKGTIPGYECCVLNEIIRSSGGSVGGTDQSATLQITAKAGYNLTVADSCIKEHLSGF